MEILLSIKSTEQSSTPAFVDELSRGGLWKITGMQKVCLITEKYFLVQTAGKGLREISISTLVDNLIKFPPLSLTFHHMTSESNTAVNEGVEIKSIIKHSYSVLEGTYLFIYQVQDIFLKVFVMKICY